MSTGDVYKLAVQSNFTGTDQIVNVFHYRQTSDTGVLTNKALALITAWEASAKAEYLACLSSRITLEKLEAKGVNGSTEEAEVNATDNGTGGAGDITPLQSAPLISWRTGESGRRKRGRTYMPPIEETLQDAGNLTSTAIDRMEDFVPVALEVDTGDGDDFELVIYSPEDLAATPPRPGTLITKVTGAIVQSIMATQRRRRQGSGS
jgi:hypothetical protein